MEPSFMHARINSHRAALQDSARMNQLFPQVISSRRRSFDKSIKQGETGLMHLSSERAGLFNLQESLNGTLQIERCIHTRKQPITSHLRLMFGQDMHARLK